MRAAETGSVEPAEAAPAERHCAFSPDRQAGYGGAGQQRNQPLSVPKLPGHRNPSGRYFAAVLVANGTFSVPGGKSGVNTA